MGKGYNFRTFKGVFTPSILTILGVIMYLRFGWVLGSVGLFETLLIVTISSGITFLTALSISQLATNMRVGGGGAYYIISRSLGIEAGGAIGIPLFFAQAVGISFYVYGFSESVTSLFPLLSTKSVACITLAVLAYITFISADLALRFQYVIFSMIALSLVSFFMGQHPESATVPAAIVAPQANAHFWPVFAVFFPAVTGIEAGLSMSGDLKNSERSLPIGTISAVLVGYAVYMAIPVFLWKINVPREILMTNFLIMKDVARWGFLIVAGLWGASLSSGLGALLGAPRTLQALSSDGVLPRWIGRGFGAKNDPRIATVISFAIALVGIMVGDLNVIAPLLSMFFLTSYGLLNMSAAFEGLIDNPSWRPRFHVHWGFALAGAAGCLLVMLMINAGATVLATVISFSIYYLMQRRRLSAFWGDMRYGILMMVCRAVIYKLAWMKPSEKTWKPNILVLSASPSTHWYLISLADAISHGKGFLTVATIMPEELADGERKAQVEETLRLHLNKRSIPAIVKLVPAEDLWKGARSLVSSYGFGPLVPNMILLGETEKRTNFLNFAHFMHDILTERKNVVVVREGAADALRDRALRIDIWWRRRGENAGLMLALGYLLKTSPEWERSRLVLKTTVEREEDREEELKNLRAFIKKENIKAEIEVYVGDQTNVFQTIRARSEGAAMVLIGLRRPVEDEDPEAYSHYYARMLSETDGFPPTALVMASEPLNFNRIFSLRD